MNTNYNIVCVYREKTNISAFSNRHFVDPSEKSFQFSLMSFFHRFFFFAWINKIVGQHTNVCLSRCVLYFVHDYAYFRIKRQPRTRPKVCVAWSPKCNTINLQERKKNKPEWACVSSYFSSFSYFYILFPLVSMNLLDSRCCLNSLWHCFYKWFSSTRKNRKIDAKKTWVWRASDAEWVNIFPT